MCTDAEHLNNKHTVQFVQQQQGTDKSETSNQLVRANFNNKNFSYCLNVKLFDTLVFGVFALVDRYLLILREHPAAYGATEKRQRHDAKKKKRT